MPAEISKPGIAGRWASASGFKPNRAQGRGAKPIGSPPRQKRYEARARAARLRQSACIEDVDYRAARGLDRALFRKLATCEWIRMRRNLIIAGPCGLVT